MSLEIGDVALGRYRVTRILGEGGMGRVYLAEHTRLGTRVALKVLLELESQDLRERFESEAELMARVHHPNTVTVLGFGHTADGFPILVMEFVEGESLADILERDGALEWSVAVPMIELALAGLDAAHEIGIVHRDIKPANILVGTGAPRTVKLADFGIAKRSNGPKRTATGFVTGTLNYMAPEVMAGNPASVVSDVYSMSTTLFALISGRLPFEDDGPLARFEREAPPLSVPSHRAPVPAPLADVVARGLARVAANRIASAAEFADALRSAMRARSAPAATRGEGPSHEDPAPPMIRPSGRGGAADHHSLPEDPELAQPPGPLAPVESRFLLVAVLPASRIALLDERRTLASLVGPAGRGYFLGAGLWFVVVAGRDAERAVHALRDAVAKRYGALMRALVAEAPVDFKLSTAQLAGAVALPAPLPDLIARLTG